jgi:hypothetical protein
MDGLMAFLHDSVLVSIVIACATILNRLAKTIVELRLLFARQPLRN